MRETIPDQTSNAGPSATEDMDWRDYLWAADEDCKSARRMEPDMSSVYSDRPMIRNRNRIAAIDRAIEALQAAKELLCR